MKPVALLAVVLAIAACGSFGAHAQTLSLAYKAGDTYMYRFHVTSKQTAAMSGISLPITVDLTANEAVAVKSVDSTGVADLDITMSDLAVKMTTGGVTNTTTGVAAQSSDVKVRPDGTVVSVDGKDVTGGNPLAALSGLGGGLFITAVLPDHAVKAGDSWSKTYDQAFPNSDGTLHIVSSSKYLRDESVNGVNAAVVETKSAGSIDLSERSLTTGITRSGFSVKGTFTTDVTTWIDPSGHRLVKSHATGHDDVTVSVPTMSASQSTPMVQGPVTATGDSTMDLAPA